LEWKVLGGLHIYTNWISMMGFSKISFGTSCATDSNTHFPAFLVLHPLRENVPETVHFPCPEAGWDF
jgi:hypothetical protein